MDGTETTPKPETKTERWFVAMVKVAMKITVPPRASVGLAARAAHREALRGLAGRATGRRQGGGKGGGTHGLRKRPVGREGGVKTGVR